MKKQPTVEFVALDVKLQALKDICANEELRHKLELIIFNSIKTLKNAHSGFSNYWTIGSNNIQNIRKQLKSLEKKYNIERDFLELYLSLDKSLYLAMQKTGQTLSLRELTLETLSKDADNTPANKFISPYTYGTIFNKQESDKIAFLIENKDLLPKSSLIFIKKKIIERDHTPKLSNLKNDFGVKSFEVSLDDVPDIDKLKVAQKTFSKTKDPLQRTLNYFYFRKALVKKYKNNEEHWKILADIDKNLFNKISSNFISSLRQVDVGVIGAEDLLKKIATELRQDEDLLLKIVSKSNTIQDENLILNFASFITKSASVKAMIYSKISQYLQRNNRTFYFNFSIASEDVKKAIIDDAKNQFLLTNKNFAWLKDF